MSKAIFKYNDKKKNNPGYNTKLKQNTRPEP